MNSLPELKQNKEVSLSDGLNLAEQLVGRYIALLNNLIQIQERSPLSPEEPAFRGMKTAQSMLPVLCQILRDLYVKLTQFEQSLFNDTPQGQGQEKDVVLSHEFLSVLRITIEHIQALYDGHTKKFAVILNDLIVLSDELSTKLLPLSSQAIHADLTTEKTLEHTLRESVLKPDEKYIFIRIFHREMVNLGTHKNQTQWIKSLFESLRDAEKHGLAIYGNEQDAIKSLKGPAYGYATLKIKQAQDISAQRLPKKESATGVTLLTVTGIKIDQIIKLTHESIVYVVQDGLLREQSSA